MKVAEVTYTGRQRVWTRRGPSGETYNLRRNDPPLELDDIEDAKRLARCRNVEVEWTKRGKLRAHGEEVLEWGYQKKRSLAADLGLSFDGQPDAETLDESLQDQIDEMHERGEI